jgi:hypothetical protein
MLCVCCGRVLCEMVDADLSMCTENDRRRQCCVEQRTVIVDDWSDCAVVVAR